jgi:hypothetical protein
MMVDEFIETLEEPRRREIRRLHELITSAAPDLPATFDGTMLGYGPFHYRYATGREGDTFLLSLASRKQHISLYVLCTDEGRYLAEKYVDRLPKASIGKSCVRFKRTDDVDLDVLRELVAEAATIGPPPSSVAAS